MNGWLLVVIALLFIIIASIYDLGPAFTKLFSTIADLPRIDTRRVRDPAVFAVLVRAMYLIVLLGIFKLLVSRKKKDDD